MSGPIVVALHRKPAKGVQVAVNRLTAIAGRGFVGHVKSSLKRQALFISTDELKALGYKPGELKEQITVDFPNMQALPRGQRIRAGEVEFEITGDCEPCGKMARTLGEDPTEFMARTDGKRGMLAKVLTDGEIRVGDPVQLLA